jgi:hypothetical protein
MDDHDRRKIEITPWTSTPDALGESLDLDLAVTALRGIEC